MLLNGFSTQIVIQIISSEKNKSGIKGSFFYILELVIFF